jgi:YfiH family protein
MPIQQVNGLSYFYFESLLHPQLVQAIFTRQGGVSSPPWSSLNVGGTVGDDPVCVQENRIRAFTAVGRDPASLYDVWQVHSASVVVVQNPRNEANVLKADVMVTDRVEVTLFMRFADCVPIMIFDPQVGAIGLAHAGWMGTVKGAASALVQAMIENFGSLPSDLRAGIGPSIGPDHYPVGQEVVDQIRTAFGSGAEKHLSNQSGTSHLNLWTANHQLLKSQGVKQIEVAEQCTACDPNRWYSHRRERGVTGRFGALIALQ